MVITIDKVDGCIAELEAQEEAELKSLLTLLDYLDSDEDNNTSIRSPKSGFTDCNVVMDELLAGLDSEPGRGKYNTSIRVCSPKSLLWMFLLTVLLLCWFNHHNINRPKSN